MPEGDSFCLNQNASGRFIVSYFGRTCLPGQDLLAKQVRSDYAAPYRLPNADDRHHAVCHGDV